MDMTTSNPRVPSGGSVCHYKNFWWDDSSPSLMSSYGSPYKNGWVRIYLNDIEPRVMDILKDEACGKMWNDYFAEQAILRFDHENCFYKVLPTMSQPLYSLWVLYLVENNPQGLDISGSIVFLENSNYLVGLPKEAQAVYVL